jgi:PP-loop superfamily ATP-utilizing enzyme
MRREKTVMDKNLERKLGSLRRRIRRLDSALVAFSGGVDSTFLTRICREELGEKAVAVTALSDNYPRSELSLARRVAKIVGVRHVVVPASGGDEKLPAVNICRGANLYSCLKSMAMRMKVKHVLDGSHADDVSDKGLHFITARKAGVKSPLLESDLSKAEIRLLAKELGLPNWDKPSSSPKPRKPLAGKAREYVQSNYPGVTLETDGSKALIVAGGGLKTLAKNLEKIEKKLRSMGFREVLLKIS